MVHDLTKSELRSIFVERDAIDADKFFIVRLHVVPADGLTLEQSAIQLLLILTGRTMRRLPYEPPSLRAETSGHVLLADESNGQVELALPIHVSRPQEGLSHLVAVLSSGAEYSYSNEFWVENVDFPKPYVTAFDGPRFGVGGMRKLFGPSASNRPLIGVILKPRAGVPLREILPLIQEALIGGCDFVADDLLLVDPEGEYELRHRVPQVMTTVNRAAASSGLPKAYFVNVSSSPVRAFDLADVALAGGATGLITNGFGMGFGAISDLVERLNGRAPVITSNLGAGILTRPRLLNSPGKPTGISEVVVSKLSRLAGADAVHAGTSASECYGSDAWGPATRALRTPFVGRKPCFAVAEGDLNIANLWDNIRSLGQDSMLEPTSGILSAPDGPRTAAKVFRDLATSLSDDMTSAAASALIERYADKNKALNVKKMLDHFGYSGHA